MSSVAVFANGDPLSTCCLAALDGFDYAIAADGGYRYARAAGKAVNVLVGDLDSISGHALDHAKSQGVEIVEHQRDKDFSDLELALRLALEIDGLERVGVFGAAGGLPGHATLALSATVGAAISGAEIGVPISAWLGAEVMHVVIDATSIPVDVGASVSLAAFGGTATGVKTAGLKWALDREDLNPIEARGLSNIAVSDRVDLSVDSGVLLAFVSQNC